MAKTYSHDQGGEYGERTRVVRVSNKAKHQGYDYIDPRGAAIAKGAAKAVGKGIGKAVVRIVAGPKKGKQ